MAISLEQYTSLRRQGYSQDEIRSIEEKGQVEKLVAPKETFAQKGLFRAAGDFLGMSEFGKGIGQALSNEIYGTQDKVIESLNTGQGLQRQLEEKIKAGRAAGQDTSRLESALQDQMKTSQKISGQVTDIGTGGLTNREVLGSAAQTGLSVIGLRGGLPTAKTFGLASSPILGGVLAGAASGGLFGAAEGITSGEPVAYSAFKGAAIGGAVGGVLGGVTKFVNNLASKTPEKNLGELADGLKTVKRSFEKNSRFQMVNGKRVVVSNPITTLAEHGAIPSVKDGKIYATPARERLRELISAQNNQALALVDEAAEAGNKISVRNFKNQTIFLIKNNQSLQEKGISNKVAKQAASVFDDFMSSFGDDLTVADVNRIRIAQNKIYNPEELDVARAIGDAARKIVYQQVPGAQPVLQREGRFIAADKFLDALDGRAIKGGRLGRYFYDLIGAMAGSSTNIPIVGPVLGALGGRQVSNFAQRQAIDPIAGRIARGAQSLPTETLGRMANTGVQNVVGQLSNLQSNQPNQQ